ncbi:hypothetical protein B0T26DRAFT_750852 [Lasiosphaeria miniovina]|uniref:Rhodopsin domain-containing protein n=1 Tax=Lasiosphaeria miniovina TaxID=1954250 RepID=A0AA40E4D8_9PEZI|nr:uncharacterized protein B0T26DRAFT_750852 [Lasiosphaeria miniovina]KAK0723591.1 hypothetical protein B0T26DRAFT_750852 [Lasiosphaeria miniovina]
MASQPTLQLDLCAIPGGVPPNGQASNLDNPESLGPTLIALSILMIVWSLLFTVARLYVNKSKLRWADYFTVVAFVLGLVYTGLVLSVSKYARHLWDIPACWYTGVYMQILFAQATILGPVIFFSKSAIFLLYLQLFPTGIPQGLRVAIYAGLFLTFCTCWAGIPLSAYFSAPHAGQPWTALITNGQPARAIPWTIVQGVMSLFLDIYLFILPLPTLFKLRLSTQRQMGLLLAFATAFMGIVTSIVGLSFRTQLQTTNDVSWKQGQLFICIIVENSLAIIVGSMPALGNFIAVHAPESALVKALGLKGRSGSSSKSDSYGPHPERKWKKWPLGSSPGSVAWPRHNNNSTQWSDPKWDTPSPPQYSLNDITHLRLETGGQNPNIKPGDSRLVRAVEVGQELYPRSIV